MYEHIASQLFGRPLMVEPSRAKVMVSALADRLSIQALRADDGSELDRDGMQAVLGNWSASSKSLAGTVDGIAVIDVAGTITHKFGHLNPSSGMVGLDGLQALIQSADADPDVRGILLDFNSPGGSVSGTFDLADLIASVETPIWSLVDELAASAAYALAAATDRIIAPRTAQIGSVGVIAMHENIAGMLEKQGREITLITAGARKAEGNSLAPLPDDVRERMQADVDEVYDMFIEAVASYRGITADAVRSTEAGVFSARQALELELIDEIMPAHDALEAFDTALRRNQPPRRKGMNAMALSIFPRKPKASAADTAADKAADDDSQSPSVKIAQLAAEMAATLDSLPQGEEAPLAAIIGEIDGETYYTEAAAREQFEPADNAASLDALVELCSQHQCDTLAKPLRDRGVTAEQAEAIMADVDAIRDKMAVTFPDDPKAAADMANRFAVAAHGSATAQFAEPLSALMVEAQARMAGEEVDHHPPETSQAAGQGRISARAVHKRHNTRK